MAQNRRNGDTPLLEVRNLTTHFFTRRGLVRAVNGVNFELMPGETLGLVGESGSGKTITCLSILRLLPRGGQIVDGEIIFDGTNIVENSAKRKWSNCGANALAWCSRIRWRRWTRCSA